MRDGEARFGRGPVRWLLALLATCGWIAGARAEDRLWVEATINAQPVHLAFDTGAGALVLFPKAVARLGLSYTNAPKDAQAGPGEVLMGRTEECDLQLASNPTRTVRTGFRVMDLPGMFDRDLDGVVGWAAVRDDRVLIDARRNVVHALPDIPAGVTNWTKFKVLTNSGVLRLQPLKPGEPTLTILVDTGDEHGVALSPAQWREWKAANTNQPRTLAAYYTPLAGLVVCEESWARRVSIGDLFLTNVPIKEADKADLAIGSVTLGLAALRYVELVIDARQGAAYLHPKEAPPPPYDHNRLGAVFVPADLQSEDLVAHTVPGSPGWEAGIRDGDVLSRIDDLDVTKWRTDPNVLPLSRFWDQSAGTSLNLTLKRGKETFKTRVVLRQILPPES
jgi:hypothetical protein